MNDQLIYASPVGSKLVIRFSRETATIVAIKPDGTESSSNQTAHSPVTGNAAIAAKRAGLDPKKCVLHDTTIVKEENVAALEAAYEEVLNYRAAAVNREWAGLNAACPGLEALRDAEAAADRDRDRFDRGFRRMMEDEDNDGARPPKSVDESLWEKVKQLRAEFPRAALYLRAKRQSVGTEGADARWAAKDCLKVLADGGTVEEAATALAVRSAPEWV